MNITVEEYYHSIQLTINAVVVEDSYDQAVNIKNAVDTYKSIFNGRRDIFGYQLEIAYSAIVNGKRIIDEKSFNASTAFADSISYLQDSANNVDIIFCDYDLGTVKGNDFFKLVEKIEKKISSQWYWILHSVGYEYLRFQNRRIFTCDSKHTEAVQEVSLKTFEENILTSILFGNPKQYSHIYRTLNENELRLIKQENYEDITLETILAVHSTSYREQYKIYFLKNDYSVQSTCSKDSLTLLKESPLFISISKGLLINKLWIGDFDITTNQIKFIRPTGKQFILDIEKNIQGRTRKPNLIKYLSTLFNQKKTKILRRISFHIPSFPLL